MNTLRTNLERVKRQAVEAAKEPPIEEPYRLAALALLRDGYYEQDGVRYTLNRTACYGSRDGDGGGASYRGPSLDLVLEWTLSPLGPVRVWSRELSGDRMYSHAECPLGCRRSTRIVIVTEIPARPTTKRFQWNGCEHFLCEHEGRAVFIEYRDLVRECHCGQDTDANNDTCAHCGELRVPAEEDSRDE